MKTKEYDKDFVSIKGNPFLDGILTGLLAVIGVELVIAA